nr:carboxypeptidase-like regulatory domain-containing protein [Phocaeicola vulgatus]
MKTPFIPKLILLFILFFLYSAGYAQQRDSVTIRGQVTDYNGQPIDSCSIFWQSPSFDDIKQAITDKNGYYTTRIPKGKYQSMGAINMSTYPHTVKPGLAEKDQRLEFWAWNFIADRDTTLNIRYHRMEVYGLRIFHIPGGMPTYQIYVRPMSLTRTLQWQKEEKSSLVHAQDLSKIEQTGLSKQAKGVLLAPSADKLKAIVWIDGEEVPVLMKQEIKEYFDATEYGNAYLLTVDMPKHQKNILPYRIFKVELTDLENGDRGEGLYYGSPDKSGGKFFNSIENLHLCTMNNQGLLALAQLILPSEILSNFEVVRVEEEASLIRIYLDESVKAEYKENPEIESKGFCEAVTIRDFPIRDKGVDLIVRRRKWYDKQNNRYFSDSYDLKAEETRYSKEFAAFLKGVYGDDSYDLPFA